MSQTTIAHHSELAADGNGYVAFVTVNDGEIIFDSLTMHGKEDGIFSSQKDADDHAEAWANAERRLESEKKALRERRTHDLPGEVLVLLAQAREDTEQADALKDGAKTCKQNAEDRKARIESLAKAADKPRMRIEWTNKTRPDGVSIVAESSVWDESFKPKLPEDPRQLSIPGVSWDVALDDNKLVRKLVGYGRTVITIEDGVMLIVLGNDEHRLEVTLGSTLAYTKVAPFVSETAETKPGADTASAPERGKATLKTIRDRLAHIKRPETLLGLYMLESQHKPRAKVLSAITDVAVDYPGPLLTDMSGVDEGRLRTQLKPDFAAAVLITNNAKPSTELLCRYVPECCDPIVLGWILDDEMERGAEHCRDEVVGGVRARLAALGIPVEEEAVDGEVEADEAESGAANGQLSVVH